MNQNHYGSHGACWYAQRSALDDRRLARTIERDGRSITITIKSDAPPRRANPICETLLRRWVRCSVTKPPIQIDQEGRTWWQTPAENDRLDYRIFFTITIKSDALPAPLRSTPLLLSSKLRIGHIRAKRQDKPHRTHMITPLSLHSALTPLGDARPFSTFRLFETLPGTDSLPDPDYHSRVFPRTQLES